MNNTQALHTVQFIDNYFPVIDGVTETVHEYACHMEHATVVCPAMESRYLEKHNFPYPLLTSMTVRVPFSRYASAVPKIDRDLEANIAKAEPDIFHLHSPSLLGKYAVSLGMKMKIPVVATFHSKYYDAILEFTKSRAIAKMVTGQIVKLYESCDEVWACSEETGETLRSYGYSKPYYVMPNGTDASFPGNPQELKDKASAVFRIPPEKHVLLFVGQQIWYKNQRLILDTFRILCDRSNDWFLIMAGSGKDRTLCGGSEPYRPPDPLYRPDPGPGSAQGRLPECGSAVLSLRIRQRAAGSSGSGRAGRSHACNGRIQRGRGNPEECQRFYSRSHGKRYEQ